MKLEDVKSTFRRYERLKEIAEGILKANHINFEHVESLMLEDDRVEIVYDAFCRERYTDSEKVPLEWFADAVDLEAEWKKENERREEEAKRVESEWKKENAAAERRRELAELKRLKKKYESKEGGAK